MMERILVPLDGSPLAEEVLPQVRRILRRVDSEILLVRATMPLAVPDGAAIAATEQDAAGKYLAELEGKLSEAGVRVRAQTQVGPAASVILSVARQEKATLIGMATHGKTGLERLLLGSVAEKVLRESPVPVLVVRPFWSYELLPRKTEEPEHRPIRTILVPLDGSDRARSILSHATEMADLFGARLVLLGVTDPKDRKATKLSVEPGSYLHGIALELEGKGLPSLCEVREGRPAAAILEAAKVHAADLIAMATHGRRGLARLVTGSVTEEVLREATCPMLVRRSVKADESPRKKHATDCVGR